MNLRDAHILSDEIELSLLEIFPDAEIFIHQDPDGYDR
jgi:divalent metal cation (Fe/Co/Zn/Cd) transporter